MKIDAIKIVFCLLLISNNIWAGNIDLSIEIIPSSINNISIGDVGEFSITITNNGPDSAGANSPAAFPISLDSERIFLENNGGFVDYSINSNINQDCDFYLTIIEPIPGGLVSVIYSFYTPIIPAGESITCHGLYHTNFENGIRAVEWSPFSVTDNDTDPSNDIALMTFRGYVPPVPSLSLYGLLFLVMMFLGITFRFSNKA